MFRKLAYIVQCDRALAMLYNTHCQIIQTLIFKVLPKWPELQQKVLV